MSDFPEAHRLEALWSGEFGDSYMQRNFSGDPAQGRFWRELLGEFPVTNLLEIGCNVGINLTMIADNMAAQDLTGVDINDSALAEAHRRLPDATLVNARARKLPFPDGSFDMVMTIGVLIHQPEQSLPEVIAEMHRCSRAYVLSGEYFAPDSEEVPYRGVDGALFRRDYGSVIGAQFPDLELVRTGFLSREEGWDSLTW